MTTDLELAAILRGEKPSPRYLRQAADELLAELWAEREEREATNRRLDEVSVALVDALWPWPRPTFED